MSKSKIPRFYTISTSVDRETGKPKHSRIVRAEKDMTEDDYYGPLARLLGRDFMREFNAEQKKKGPEAS